MRLTDPLIIAGAFGAALQPWQMGGDRQRFTERDFRRRAAVDGCRDPGRTAHQPGSRQRAHTAVRGWAPSRSRRRDHTNTHQNMGRRHGGPIPARPGSNPHIQDFPRRRRTDHGQNRQRPKTHRHSTFRMTGRRRVGAIRAWRMRHFRPTVISSCGGWKFLRSAW